MSQIIQVARSDLFSLTQAGHLLGVDRRTVADLAKALNLSTKRDPTRTGKMLDRADLDRLARTLGRAQLAAS